MAVFIAFVFVVGVIGGRFSNVQGCPENCICTVLHDNTTEITCTAQLTGIQSGLWPASTSKLDLSKAGLLSIQWLSFAPLKNLQYLNLDSQTNIKCDCDYYKYWKEHIGPSALTKLKEIKGRCSQPTRRQDKQLSVAGSEMSAECEPSPTPLLVKPSPTVTSTAQEPSRTTSAVLVSPSKTDELKAAVPTKTSETSSSESVPSTSLKSVSESIGQPLAPAPISTVKREQTSIVSQEASTTLPSYQPLATAMPTTSIVPPTSSSLTPEATRETTSSTTKLPTTTLPPPPPPPQETTTPPPETTTTPPETTTPPPETTTTPPETTTPPPETTTTPPPETTTTPPPPPPPETTTEETTTETPLTTSPPKPGPPTILLYQLNPDLKIGSVARVVCQVDGFPKPEVEMIFNGQDTKALNMFQPQNKGAKIVFEAKFTSEILCYASNQHGTRKARLQVVVKQGSISYFILIMKLFKEEYSDEYKFKTSSKFQNLQKRINEEFLVVFKEFFGFYGASLVQVRSGSVVVHVLVKTTNTTRDRAKKVIQEEIQDAKFGSIPVDRYFFSFKDESKVCTGEYLNVTWSDMVVNQTMVEKCPRQAQGFAQRNCTVNGWYWPDYTRCKSDPFTLLRNQMESATDGSSLGPSMEIVSILKQLKNLTVAYRDYSHVAGDLISGVDIIDMLTNYTKHQRNDIALNDEEAQLVVDVTSNLINKNHEQELIIAQKLVQTASTLIHVAEEYGLQAAIAVSNGTEELKFFISENLVMGAGMVEPFTVTKDVTFPNYDLPEVDAIRTAWRASSFIVIDKEIIADMTKVKRFKVAGFLYRTLTRILSFESAYSVVGQGFEINSAVVSLSLKPPLPPKLKRPIIIASNNLDPVQLEGDSPICAFWDFKLNAPNGGWSDKGCWYTHYNTHNTTCLCEHLTNFGVLREKPIVLVAEQRGQPIVPPFLLCILIGCIIMICFCGITLFLLLLFAWKMKPDRTWGLHMFVCATLITAFALIIVGLYSYNESIFFCSLLSMLVHYFYLCAFTWIMSEATYMFVWSATDGPKKRYWIGYFFLGFVPPGIPMTIAWLVKGMQNFESPLSCWMSYFPSLFWLFFIPAVFFTLITMVIFRKVWKTATGNLRFALKATYWRTRFRVHVRYSIAIQLLLILIWVFGLLVITFHTNPLLQLVFCILFILFCAITGLVILVFYCLMDRQFDHAIRECFCYCCNRGKYNVQKREDLWAEHRRDEEPEQVAEIVTPEHQSFVESQHDPLIVYVTRRPPASEPSMSSIDDPLYERVKKPGEEQEPEVVPEQEQKPQDEPVYAKVHKEEEDDDDPFPIVVPGSPRFLRGLTRQEVLRMAKKSDAAKKELKKYESPKGSRDDLAEHPTYLLNQQELDEELQHFRTFFAENKQSSPRPSTSSKTPPGTPRSPHLPRTYSAASSTSSTTKTTKVVKKTSKKTHSSTKTEGSPDKQSVVTHESRQESFESSYKHEVVTHRTARGSDTPPAIPPRAPDLLDDDDDYYQKDSDAKTQLLDVQKDDDSLTDVSAADDLDRDSDDDEDSELFGSRPTAV